MVVGAVLLYSLCISSLPTEQIRALLPPQTDDHMTIILYADLTTSLTKTDPEYKGRFCVAKRAKKDITIGWAIAAASSSLATKTKEVR